MKLPKFGKSSTIITSLARRSPLHRWMLSNGCHQHACPRAVKLSYDVIGRQTSNVDRSPVIILHGLFGSKTNWATMAKKIHRETQRTIFTVDLRNHGDSQHGDNMSVDAMRDDLLMLMRNELRVDRCTLIGHSLGGTIAMFTALSQPQVVDKLVIVDISPLRTYSRFQVPEFISAMRGVEFDQNVTLSQNRRNAGTQLREVIQNEDLLHFILTNVVERDGRCQWRLNLQGLAAGLEDLTFNLIPTSRSTYDGPVLFIRGGKSRYITSDQFPTIKTFFPTARISTVEGAGHFVHSENPSGFLESVLPFLKS